jgi:tripartite-type tricarboxylate transporter receptor subunit TctC
MPVLLRLLLIISMFGVLCGSTHAQGEWPNKPVRIVVPWPAGGSADIVGRLLAERLGVALRQNFIVENRAGASGMIGSTVVANAEPDGYTFLISGIPSQVIAPAISAAPTFDPMKDFTHIAYIGGSPIVAVAHSSLGVKSLRELIGVAKGRTEPMAYVSAGVGSLGNLLAELLADKEKIKLAHVPYKGGAQAVSDLVAGHVKLGWMTWSTAQTHIRAGTLIPLAISSSKRIPGSEQVPTMKELGHDDLTTTTWWAFSGPAKLPALVVRTLNREIVKAIASPEINNKLSQEAIETEDMSSEQFTLFVDREIKKWGPIAKQVMKASSQP